VEALGFSPAKSDSIGNGFSRGWPGLKPFSIGHAFGMAKAMPFHRFLRTLSPSIAGEGPAFPGNQTMHEFALEPHQIRFRLLVPMLLRP
jgi:hypothetical protein